MKKGTRKGERYVKKVFGGPFQQQGRGFYVALELFAILRGSLLLEKLEPEIEYVLPNRARPAEFVRPTHDFARRLMADWFDVNEPEKQSKYLDVDAAATVRALLIGLHAPVPGRRNTPTRWRQWHLYPYPPDFIHYDALQRKGQINIERDSYRGGGGLAHRILREDDDVERLSETREHFRRLLDDSQSPLGALARALAELDEAKHGRTERWKDSSEESMVVRPSPWTEHLRDGTHRILVREGIPDSKRIEALMHWVPYCLLRHQQSLAYTELEGETSTRPKPTVFDCQPENNPIRDRARTDFQQSTAAIRSALVRAVDADAQLSSMDKDELVRGSSSWLQAPRTFFTTTAYAVGAANAPTGVRWFTIAPELLETIVLAKVEHAIPFDEFCENVLYGQLGMIVGPRAALEENIIGIDQSNFNRNARMLAETLDELGLLERYSDMTRMVGAKR